MKSVLRQKKKAKVLYVHSCPGQRLPQGKQTGQVYPRTSLILASGRRGRRITVCPRLTRAIHKAPCLKDWQKAADPRLYLHLLHFLSVEWWSGATFYWANSVWIYQRWSGRKGSSTVVYPPTSRSQHGRCCLGPAAFLPGPWCPSAPRRFRCPCSITAAWPASSLPCASVE